MATGRSCGCLSGDYPDKLAEMIALWERYKEDNGVLDVALDLGEMVH
jgi:hypothetical protein